MKICEVIAPLQVVPSQVQSQRRINMVAQQLAAKEATWVPTPEEQEEGIKLYKQWKDEIDDKFQQQLEQRALQKVKDEKAAAEIKKYGRERR